MKCVAEHTSALADDVEAALVAAKICRSPLRLEGLAEIGEARGEVNRRSLRYAPFPPVSSRENPAVSEFRLMPSPPRGKVHNGYRYCPLKGLK